MEIQKESVDLIVKNFELSKTGIPSQITIEELKNILSKKIQLLLEKDVEKLLQILYRVDINENKSKIAFSKKSVSLIALNLAELIIQRQIEKMKTRERYREQGNS